MSTTKKISNSSNSSDNEKDFLEEEFLKMKIEDIPIPKKELEDYELDIEEVMKSGCNRQIAEYAIEEIKKLEESPDNTSTKLLDLRKKYRGYIEEAIKQSIEDLSKFLTSNSKDIEESNLENYDDEIDEILNSEKIQKLKDNIKEDQNLDNVDRVAKYYLEKNLENIEKDENYKEIRKKYIEKREAVIEAALRKIKKIVNDENEYNIFYNNYFNIKK